MHIDKFVGQINNTSKYCIIYQNRNDLTELSKRLKIYVQRLFMFGKSGYITAIKINSNTNEFIEKYQINNIIFVNFTIMNNVKNMRYFYNIRSNHIKNIYFFESNHYDINQQINWIKTMSLNSIWNNDDINIDFIDINENNNTNIHFRNITLLVNPDNVFLNKLIEYRGSLPLTLVDKLKYQCNQMECTICMDKYDELLISQCCLLTICRNCFNHNNSNNCIVCRLDTQYYYFNHNINIDNILQSKLIYINNGRIFKINNSIDLIFYYLFINDGQINLDNISNIDSEQKYYNPVIIYKNPLTKLYIQRLYNACISHIKQLNIINISDIELYKDVDSIVFVDGCNNVNDIHQIMNFTKKTMHNNILIFNKYK